MLASNMNSSTKELVSLNKKIREGKERKPFARLAKLQNSEQLQKRYLEPLIHRLDSELTSQQDIDFRVMVIVYDMITGLILYAVVPLIVH